MKIINSVQNETIKYYEKLKDKTFRKETGLFIIEGYHTVQEALKTSLVDLVLSTDEEFLQKIEKQVKTCLVNDAIIKKLSNTKNPQNVVAIVKMFSTSDDQLSLLIKENTKELKIVAFDEINDPGNLGTLIRTAAALGYQAVVLSKNSVDVFNDKTLRASQGAIFKIKIIYTELDKALKYLHHENVKLIGTSLQKAKNLNDVKRASRYLLCLGNEARGISSQILDLMDENIKLTMHNDVESLNVMIAGSIILYELAK